MKTCSKCEIEKHYSDFHKTKLTRDGHHTWCKECYSIYRKKYYKENKLKIAERNKKYREKNKKRASEYHKKYYEENKDDLLKRHKDYYKKNQNYFKKQYEENKEAMQKKSRDYYAKNKEKIKKRDHNYYEQNKKRENSNALYYSHYAKKISWHEYTEKGEGGLLLVKCKYCGKKFNPKVKAIRMRSDAINMYGIDKSGLYCSSGCKKACPTFGQQLYYRGNNIDGSSREVQPELRQMCLERDDYTCQKCNAKGKQVQLHCHHIKSLADDPIESADVDNTITLCKACHKAIHKTEGCQYHQLKCPN